MPLLALLNATLIFIILITRRRLSTAKASSSFKWLNTCTSMSITPTFITEALCLITYVTTAVLNNCYSEVTAYKLNLIRLVSTTRMDAYVTPTNYIDYSCHIKAIELI